MTFNEIMNSPLLYGLVGAGIIYILIFCALTFRKAYGHALEIGMSKEKLRSVMVSTAIYSIVPSLSIVVGLFSLATVIGVPWAWFRLSVVGAVAYEVTAADMAATGAGYESIAALDFSTALAISTCAAFGCWLAFTALCAALAGKRCGKRPGNRVY